MNQGGIVRRVLVTSGPTRAYIDCVRYIANASTGALGSRIVEALTVRNIPVVHLYGYGSERPKGEDRVLFEAIPLTTVDDLVQAVRTAAKRGDIAAVVHSMAVLDYVPETRIKGKMPSGEDHWDIRLVRTPKVIGLMRELMPDACIVAFKLESGISDSELVTRAAALMEKYRLDLVVANSMENIDSRPLNPPQGGSWGGHEALFVGAGGQVLARFSTKLDIAAALAGFIAERL